MMMMMIVGITLVRVLFSNLNVSNTLRIFKGPLGYGFHGFDKCAKPSQIEAYSPT